MGCVLCIYGVAFGRARWSCAAEEKRRRGLGEERERAPADARRAEGTYKGVSGIGLLEGAGEAWAG